MVLFGVARTWLTSDDATQAELQHPLLWEPIRQHFEALFPEYRGLRPGSKGPNRSQFYRWYNATAHNGQVADSFNTAFERNADAVALALGIADPKRHSPTRPHLADCVFGDGTSVKSRFNHGPKDRQLNRLTGELEQMPHDPDSSHQWRKNDVGEPVRSDVAGTPFGFFNSTTGHTGENVVLAVFKILTGPGHSEMKAAMKVLRELKERLPGLDAVLYDMAARGMDIDEGYCIGVQIHAKVPFTDKAAGKAKERLVDVGLPARRDGEIVGKVDITALGGAAHLRTPFLGNDQLILLIPKQVRERRSRRTNAITRVLRDYKIPDDPRVPARLRGAIVQVRHNSNDADRRRGLNRAEVLRLIAQEHDDWELVAQRNRAESLNQWVKRHWPDKRGPAVGRKRQQLRLTFAAIGLNVIAAIRYRQRTGINLLGPPGPTSNVA